MPEDLDTRQSSPDNLSEIVRRAILEAADMKDIEERARQIGERNSKLGLGKIDEADGGPVT